MAAEAQTVATDSFTGFVTITEQVVLPSAASTDSTFTKFQVPAGRDFVVIANVDAVNLTADADIDVEGSHDDGTTWFKMKSDLIGSIDNTTAAAVYDASANGEMIHYRLVADHDGNQAAEDLKCVVVYPSYQ